MIGVLVPAHDEAATIGRCLRSLQKAARHPGLNGCEVRIVVALDACSDSTAAICRELQVETIDLQARCVGAARAAAAARLLQQGARWLASTDADGTVPPQWLAAQLDARSDAFCGVVDVAASGRRSRHLRRLFRRSERWGDGHGRVHGANLGVSAQAYRDVGGFAALGCGEDVDLVRRLSAAGASVRWAGAPVVTTSTRLLGRARGGFADYLAGLTLEQQSDPAVCQLTGTG
ncbi:glycosyltransferase [Stenotrophomonas indicatrix]|uniref:glycosyltransferase n=1 Tax=Stenotrophomonas indicatrix TaxID=2045451 RepID=UPI0032095D46